MITFYLVVSIPFIYSVSYSRNTSDSTGNWTSPSLKECSNELPSSIREIIIEDTVNKPKAAIVIGFVDSSEAKIFGYGNVSKDNNIPVNGSTFF